MKKKLRIVLWVLFAISAVFIGTGALLVDNTFYIKNGSDVIIKVKCETVDGEFTDYTISVGDSVEVFNNKVFQLNNNSADFELFFKEITITALNDTLEYHNLKWEVFVDGRKNKFVYTYNPL